MPSAHAYPPDLARYVAAHWPPAHPLRVPQPLLEQAVSVAFHASLTAEEARPTRFRLLLTPPHELPSSGVPNEGVLRLTFERPRPFHADELRRLAPAVPFETALIGVYAMDEAIRIWGVAHSGPAWLAPTWGGRSLVPNWTYDPILHVTGPGQVAVRCAGVLIGAIDRGALVDSMMDVFESEWLPAMFVREREEVRTDHAARQAESSRPTTVDHSLVGRVTQHMLRRAIRLVRGAHHGGMFLVLDTDSNPGPASMSGLRVKYEVGRDEPANRYRTLLFRLLDVVANTSPKTAVGWSDFVDNQSPALAELEQAVFEWSRVLANLAAIDGAVVLDKRFALLGFGAEVLGELPSPFHVSRALDTEGGKRMVGDVEGVGTRHRAAYRFVQEHPGGLAIVVSHDGGVSFVRSHEGDVVFWEQSMNL